MHWQKQKALSTPPLYMERSRRYHWAEAWILAPGTVRASSRSPICSSFARLASFPARGATGVRVDRLSAGYPNCPRSKEESCLRTAHYALRGLGSREIRPASATLGVAYNHNGNSSLGLPSAESFFGYTMCACISLFNPEFIPYIAPLLNVDSKELHRINLMSQDESVVCQWVKTNLAGEDAKIAHDAYVVAALRGAGTIICTKLRQEYFKHEVRECSSSPDESCAGVRRVLPFGTLSL